MSEAARGSLRDHHFDYRLRSHWIDARDYVTGATSNTGGPATLTCGYTGGGLNTPLQQIGNTRLWGAAIATLGATLSYQWRPSDLDNRHPVYVRYWWTSSVADTAVATFNTVYATLTTDAAPLEPRTPANTAAVGVAKSATALALTMTRPAKIGPLGTGAHAGSTFSLNAQAINLAVSVSSLTRAALATDFVWLHAVEVLYTPQDTFGDGSARQARFVDPPLQNMEVSPATDFKV